MDSPEIETEHATENTPDRPTVVLVHGAFADASGWAAVIRLLQQRGFPVVAVQNPLTSYADDVATTRRLIAAQPGPVVPVGHSYGGAVITAAAAGAANVGALVYVAAFAPDAGESIGTYLSQYPTPLGAALRPDAAGALSVDPAAFHDVFAADVPRADADVMAVTQKPIAGAAFTTPAEAAAWRTVPSWYVVAQQDRAIHPDLERFYARRMGAATTELPSSHVPYLSHPAETVAVIEQAARATALTAAAAGR